MLGRTAGSLFWMFRYLERMETTARLLEAGFQIALTRNAAREDIWQSVINTANVAYAFEAKYGEYSQSNVVDFLLRDTSTSHSVRSMMDYARDNARAARTALTIEIWEAVNSAWLDLGQSLKRPVKTRDLPSLLKSVLKHSQLVRGALHGTMLRNDIYDFLRLGNFVERFESTARILDVKYYVLLPSVSHVGAPIDNVQWEIILRSVSGYESYRWLNQGQIDPRGIAKYLILDTRFPRSMAYCARQNYDHLSYLSKDYGETSRSLALSEELQIYLKSTTIEQVFAAGLHEFLQEMMIKNAQLGAQIESDYRFYG